MNDDDTYRISGKRDEEEEEKTADDEWRKVKEQTNELLATCKQSYTITSMCIYTYIFRRKHTHTHTHIHMLMKKRNIRRTKQTIIILTSHNYDLFC